MNYRIHIPRAATGLFLLVSAWAYLTPACCDTGTATAAAGTPAIDQDASQAILQELREIRRVLEKIERQGLGRPARRPDTPQTASVSIGKEPTQLGAADAPVTVVEFTDYQCPFCKRFIQTTFPQLKRDYIDTGKVRWIVRDLPLGFHANANKAAIAAHCAGDQGKYWEMRDILFKNNANLGNEKLPRYAREIGLDAKEFDACLSSDRHQSQIDQSSREAGKIRVTGTPSFIIGKTAGDTVSGKLVIGAQPTAVFIAGIQRVLNQAAPGKNPPEKKSDAD
jgi:protein-disulfide isomerase